MMLKTISSSSYILFFTFALLLGCSKSPKLQPDVLSSQGPPATVTDSQKVTLSVSNAEPLAIAEASPYSIVVNFDKPNVYAMNLIWSFNEGISDWAAVSGIVHIAAGSTSATVLVRPMNDNIFEPVESYTLNVSSSMALNTLSVPVNLSSEDAIPSLSILPTPLNENDSGTMTFIISNPSYQSIMIDYSIANGTATFGSDLTVPLGQTGTLTIPAGSTSVSLPWSALEDLTVESLTETATLTASKNILSGDFTKTAAIGSGSQYFTVYDNDLATVNAYIASNSATVNENVGQVSVSINLNKASANPVDFAYDLSGTAIASQDYSLSPGVVRFQAGEISKTINIPIINDSLPELTNTIVFSRFGVTGATSSGLSAITFTIKDDDDFVTASIALPSSNTMSESGDTLLVPFLLDKPAGDALTLKYTISGTTSPYHDYTTSSSYIIPAGSTSGNLSIPIIDDIRDELDETLIVTIVANSSEYYLGQNHVFTSTISDNDNAPTLNLLPVTQKEGCDAVFYAKLTTPVGYDVTFDYATSAGTASAGSDFTTTTGTRTIPAGRQGIGIRVPLATDGTSDSDETFTMTISNMTGPTALGTSVATGTIKESFPSIATTTQLQTFSAGSIVTNFGKNSCYTISYGILSGAYDNDFGFLYYMNLFGAEPIPISDEGEAYNQIYSFTSDTSRILAFKSRTSSTYPPSDLIAIDIDGNQKANLTPSGAGSYSNLSMTNDGQKIVFIASPYSSTRKDLYVVDTRATFAPSPHVNCGSYTGCTSPILSNNNIVYLSDARVSAQFELFSQSVSSSTGIKLHSDLPVGRIIKTFLVTEDQSRIIFSSDKDNSTAGAHDLFSVNFDGSGETKINTLANQGVRSFAISANSQKISWVQELGKTIISNLDGSSQIQIGSADGTHGLSTTYLPTLLFSPNGSYVAACLFDNTTSKYHVYSYKSDGTAEVALKNNVETACSFSFSTDSLLLIYPVKSFYYDLVAESIAGGTEVVVSDAQSFSFTIIDVGDSSGYLIYRATDSFSFISNYYKKRKLDGTVTGQINYTTTLASSYFYLPYYYFDKVNSIFQWASESGPFIRNSN